MLDFPFLLEAIRIPIEGGDGSGEKHNCCKTFEELHFEIWPYFWMEEQSR